MDKYAIMFPGGTDRMERCVFLKSLNDNHVTFTSIPKEALLIPEDIAEHVRLKLSKEMGCRLVRLFARGK